MSDYLKTMNLLAQAGLPMRTIDPDTIRFWLREGYSPERVAREIFSVQR